MEIKKRIEADLKTAMLAGDKTLVTTLRGLKSAILYVEVAGGHRDKGLSDAAVTEVLQKEAKKRQESADLYKRGGSDEKEQAELAEKVMIAKYLPEAIGEAELREVVGQQVTAVGATGPQDIGKVIGAVKAQVGAQADGANIARLVKEVLAGKQ